MIEGILNKQVIVRLLDGDKIEGVLTGGFNPGDNQVVISDSAGVQQTLPLDAISTVWMNGEPEHDTSAVGETMIEDVETLAGTHYQVRIPEKKKYATGFLGYPIEPLGHCNLIFFTFKGIKNRQKNEFLGEILANKGAISESQLNDVLDEQKKLKNRRLGEILADFHDLDQQTIEGTITKTRTVGKTLRVKIGEILVAAGLVTREQVEEALASQETGKKKKIGALLVEKGLVTEEQLLLALAAKFRMRFVNLEDVVPSQSVLDALSLNVVKRMQVFPVELHSDRLGVATSDPTDPFIVDTLRFYTNKRVDLVVATSGQIAKAIEKYYLASRGSVEEIIGELSEEEVSVEDETEDAQFDETDSQVIKLVNKVLIDAYKKGVSDIHFEPGLGQKPFKIRYRIDGVCHEAHKIPSIYNKAIISRIKIISGLDIAEHRKPQSGKIGIRYRQKKVEYRVEITPTVGGNQDAVLRILSSSKSIPLEEMAFSSKNIEGFKEMLAKPYGIILCVGPTGSGKTTTLHAALSVINSPERKIWTAEDPVEITQEGLRQVQVHYKIGFTFQEALRSFLRADPDVIMIGEMRDAETAKTAIEASLTGHLVFSTLHTNSAPETVIRLIEMGMDSFNFADAFLCVLAQRLARKLCLECRRPYHPGREEYDELVRAYGRKWFEKDGLPEYDEGLELMGHAECPSCGGIGFQGRIAIHEMLLGIPEVKNAIKTKATVEELQNIGLEHGMRTLKMDGIRKIFEGRTDLLQVLKVCL
ncbi:MAG: ATPase, T2SS/T4P/T4SS family [Desulfobacterales bacterium]|nr:ATPase, T2SS/T4P/T4SS family [Desulfobacterales bacterium]MDD3080993.1 ATPase, T2SS/T4P/T4SS family [Desulfobacterales bacterium]MDD3950398.1 ATPase, T2SS/T4P/T4SS family [Desulfobacterales bacterium]